jgi:chaperonin GroES
MEKLRPLGDRVLVKRMDSEEITAGGIIIPDAAKEKPQTGKVVAIGTGRLAADGKIMPMQVKPGDKVFLPKYAGTDAGENLIIVREDEILGIME